jgi:hypothetical protein
MLHNKDITRPYPQPQDNEEESWISSCEPTTASSEFCGDLRPAPVRGAMSSHVVLLVKEIEEIACLMSGKQDRRPTDFTSQVSEAYLRLLQWRDNLPMSLTCNTAPDSVASSHVILLQ